MLGAPYLPGCSVASESPKHISTLARPAGAVRVGPEGRRHVGDSRIASSRDSEPVAPMVSRAHWGCRRGSVVNECSMHRPLSSRVPPKGRRPAWRRNGSRRRALHFRTALPDLRFPDRAVPVDSPGGLLPDVSCRLATKPRSTTPRPRSRLNPRPEHRRSHLTPRSFACTLERGTARRVACAKCSRPVVRVDTIGAR
jgi:hypothetical protein